MYMISIYLYVIVMNCLFMILIFSAHIMYVTEVPHSWELQYWWVLHVHIFFWWWTVNCLVRISVEFPLDLPDVYQPTLGRSVSAGNNRKATIRRLMARMVASSIEYQAGTRKVWCSDSFAHVGYCLIIFEWIWHNFWFTSSRCTNNSPTIGVQGVRIYVAFPGGCPFSAGGRLVCQML